MEKNKLLKVSSILMIIGGAFLAIMALIMFIGGELVASIIGSTAEEDSDIATAAVKVATIILGIAFLIEAAAYIAAGVIGVQQKSAKTCFVVAIIVIVVCGIGAIMNIVEGQFTGIVSLVVPILYLVGAIQLRKAAQQAEEAQTTETVETTTTEE